MQAQQPAFDLQALLQAACPHLTAAAGSAGNSADESAEEGPTRPPAETPGAAMPRCWDYGDIAERMEVIHPKDVSLAKFLGSGGYGEVYLGKWHSSEAAIKCLNPSLFFNEGQVSLPDEHKLACAASVTGLRNESVKASLSRCCHPIPGRHTG